VSEAAGTVLGPIQTLPPLVPVVTASPMLPMFLLDSTIIVASQES